MRRAADIERGTDVEGLMRMAIAATRGTYPHPNPRVGAVLTTSDGDVRAIGAHQRPGTPHAERDVLAQVGDAHGDTLIVTLEPCNHTGRTPPCTEAIIDAGIARVVIGTVDPDRRVAGSGIARLRAAGIEVIESGLVDLVESNDPGYYHHRRTGRPRVTLKLAMTLDGQIAAADGTSQWITSDAARADAHTLRAEHDAVAVGAGTVITDDPRLDVRLPAYGGPQPLPVILAGRRSLPEDAAVLERAHHLAMPGRDGLVDLDALLDQLGDAAITRLLVEGGAHVARSFLEGDLVDDIVIYLGAKLAAGSGIAAIAGQWETLADAVDVEITDISALGPDIKITARRRNHI